MVRHSRTNARTCTLQDKCKDMYRGKYLKAVQMALRESETFIQGRVSAEVITKCVYKVDIRLHKHHVLVECQCEYAARMGPEAHCQHVAVTLHALTQAGKGIITMETCTQVLKTFHQAKKHTGSPVKMNELELRTGGL